jgi:hypothetical protein
MASWHSKWFGDNRFNFYGWMVAGNLALVGSFWLAMVAARWLRAGYYNRALFMVLVAIYLVLVAHLGLALHRFCADLSKKLDAQRRPNLSAEGQPERRDDGEGDR